MCFSRDALVGTVDFSNSFDWDKCVVATNASLCSGKRTESIDYAPERSRASGGFKPTN